MAIEFLQVMKRFIVRGNVSLDTVPPLDGALLPNNLLEAAPMRGAGPIPEPSSVESRDGFLIVASRSSLLRTASEGTDWKVLAEFPSLVTALTRLGEGWVVATQDDGIFVLAMDGSVVRTVEAPGGSRCVTDLVAGPDGQLIAAVGSRENAAAHWHVDLMQKGTTGSIWSCSAAGESWIQLLDGLGWPSGVSVTGDVLTYTEAWRHRVTQVSLTHPQDRKVLVRNLPGYPGRIRTADGGGFWLCVFAMRTQLVEFVLTQDDYRRDMMAEIDPRFWVRPDLRTLNTGLVPLQGGGIKKLGQTKPWAPPRSYGLLVRLDDAGEVTRSFHSRAGGTHHGITGVCVLDGDVVACAQGGDAVLTLGKV